MSKLKLFIISANMVLVLLFFGFNIVKNEKVLSEGEIVLLELRPVDPRSLMQGDYMTLHYEVCNHIYGLEAELNKFCVVQLDDDRVAHFVSLTNDAAVALREDELLLRYSLEKNSWGGKFYTIGSDSYFFQEGTANKYATAKYGMLKVVTKGEMIGTCSLVGLCDADKNLIK
ncbi:MAG: GDYXXLXY domain-containing protein [Paludibacteraceae bacterium]|nr:GDYXXLXY domain-containing protein [Paludibacteraceae bacterium]